MCFNVIVFLLMSQSSFRERVYRARSHCKQEAVGRPRFSAKRKRPDKTLRSALLHFIEHADGIDSHATRGARARRVFLTPFAELFPRAYVKGHSRTLAARGAFGSQVVSP